jgi:hypothetical protein
MQLISLGKTSHHNYANSEQNLANIQRAFVVQEYFITFDSSLLLSK